MTPDLACPLRDPNSMSCLREVQTISKSPHILPMPSLTRLTTGGVLNPLKNTTNTSHNGLLHQDPLQPPLEPRSSEAALADYSMHSFDNHMAYFEEGTRTSQDFANIVAGGQQTTDEEWAAIKEARTSDKTSH